MTEAEILQLFQDTGAIRSGHFRLTSGRHSDTYIQCARVLEHPRLTHRLCEELVARIPAEILEEVDLVASPAVGGILFGFALADVLDKPMIFSERVNGQMEFRRAFELAPGSKVLVAEDVVTSGGSVQEVIELVTAAKAEALAVASLIDRGGKPLFQAPFFPLLHLDVPSWSESDCELCKQEIPLYAPGSRALSVKSA